ncbi:uncharacterized protein LOC120787544 isoform X2 [Xiphias gladius]|uniref:uncharacterized protein LOC120787544 isoform X2 n=1 Tax=Xiphias gladius TaxID=8245 RepID=UPI001A99240A|nr:uncharacterized protein LOC120787544 isoform X2 [Xiphias gladius]
MEKPNNKRKREQDSSPGAIKGLPEKRSCDNIVALPERSSSPQPSTSGSQVYPVETERSSSPQPSTPGSQRGGQDDAQQELNLGHPERSSSPQPSTSVRQRGRRRRTTRRRRRRRRRGEGRTEESEEQARLWELHEGSISVEVLVSGLQPIVHMPPWYLPATRERVLSYVGQWWMESPYCWEM